jgi:subfamily B ATP-binding cassette protein HlyB/CyaB
MEYQRCEVLSINRDRGGIYPPQASKIDARKLQLQTVAAVARFHGVELNPHELSGRENQMPSSEALVDWVRQAGLWARGAQLKWRHLMGISTSNPVVLLLQDGGAALMIRADPARNVVWLRDPLNDADKEGVAVDELRLSQRWSGAALLIRGNRGRAFDDQDFSFLWLGRLIWLEKRMLHDIVVASLVLSILAIFPAFIVMNVVDRVLTYQSTSTLVAIAAFLALGTAYETLLGYGRRRLIQRVATRLDAKLYLHVFKRLLALPIDFFERTQTGAITYQISQIGKIRDFITGKLMHILLDALALIVLLPILFWLNATLSWLVLGCGAALTLNIALWLKPIRRVFGCWQRAEIEKSTALVENVQGIRTVKALALEPQHNELWDHKVAEAASWKQTLGDMSNWPQSIATPLESFLSRGVILVGAYLALVSGDLASSGSLVAFMMLSGRVAQPLVGVARLIEDLEEVRAAMTLAARVLNRAPETTEPEAGLRPAFEGAISFDKITFAYPGRRAKALSNVTFAVSSGTTLGVVGRSGSGKSTVTRLLQGIDRDYEGAIKIDGNDLRSINLGYLRRNLGVVLQENFLFRGSIKDNIIAGRPGLTLIDVVRACRLAGAEEFIETMPQGYDTFVEEGSANLSGGQRQRLAIARALIHDPRILILDEATSALDPESEALVNNNIARIGHGRTMLIVSHRLSSLVRCDRIMVLDQGRVMDVGPHRELLERCTVYRQLWMQQNRHLEDPCSAATATAMLAQTV